MEFIEWNDSLSVGVRQFDEEHKNLVTFVNKLNHALQIGDTKNTMEEILRSLIKYTIIHFTHEEELMQTYDYPELAEHRKQHQELTAKVTEFHERLKSGKSSFSLELMSFLRDWLINHIQGADKKYRDFFIAKGV